MILTLWPDTFSTASLVCSSGWRDVEMLGSKREWRGDAVFYHYFMMFGVADAVFVCKRTYEPFLFRLELDQIQIETRLLQCLAAE